MASSTSVAIVAATSRVQDYYIFHSAPSLIAGDSMNPGSDIHYQNSAMALI